MLVLVTTTSFSYNYLAVPVLLRYNVTEKFNVHAGSQRPWEELRLKGVFYLK